MDSIRGELAHYAFRNGVAHVPVERTVHSRVKENLALCQEATRLRQQQSTEANQLLKQFLDGNANPGIGNNR